MGQLNNYEGPAKVFFEGQLVAEAKNARFRVSGNNNKVVTMARQLAGKSDGARESEITLTNAVPRAGFEENFITRVVNGDFVRVVFNVGGARFQFTCWCDDGEYTASVDNPSELSVTLMGGPPEIS